MKVQLDLDTDGKAFLESTQKKTGLNLKGVFNEALTIYAQAIEARELEGKELALVSEKGEETLFRVLETPGLKNIQLKVP